MMGAYEYDYPEEWHFGNIVDYADNEEWKALLTNSEYLEVYDKLYLEDELALYNPPEEERTLTYGQKHQRLIFYGHILEKDEEEYFYTPIEE